MANQAQWEKLINRGNYNRIDRVLRTLFQDMQKTATFFSALLEVLASPNQARGDITELVRRVRIRTRELPGEELDRALKALMAHERRAECYILMCGAYRTEVEESVATFQRLASLAEQDYSVLSTGTQMSTAHLAIIALIAGSAVKATSVWTNLLRWSKKTGNRAVLKEVLSLMPLGITSYHVVPYSQWRNGDNMYQIQGDVIDISIPVPDELHDWARREAEALFEGMSQRDDALVALAKGVAEDPKAWCDSYENMWLEMMLEPRWGLRENGLDCVTVQVPELRKAGHRSVRLYPEESFPAFRAVFHMAHANGSDRYVEMRLEPSDLHQVQQPGTERAPALMHWVDRILAFTAVRAMWTIVMGHLSEEKEWSAEMQGAPGAVVRPRFRRLPTGHRASPEARARALETFRQEPLPGFTFVRQHTRGAFPQSGAPLFSLSELGVH